jgi:serine/threonine protein kinase
METEGAWPTHESEYRILNVIGSGAFATVHRAECISKKVEVAIKIIDLETGGECK